MELSGPLDQPVREEITVLLEKIDFSGAKVLELGCGSAVRTEQMARETDLISIVGAEIDLVAHQKNLIKDIDKVQFECFGAQAIEADSASFDAVIMLKSLHHVPETLMRQSMSEIRRVLKPGGLAYLSEPVFQGELNEVIKLFHNEERVRKIAFESVLEETRSGRLELVEQYFYRSPVRFDSFDQFRRSVMDATYQTHQANPGLVERVRVSFASHKRDNLVPPFLFETPNRVDLLKKL